MTKSVLSILAFSLLSFNLNAQKINNSFLKNCIDTLFVIDPMGEIGKLEDFKIHPSASITEMFESSYKKSIVK